MKISKLLFTLRFLFCFAFMIICLQGKTQTVHIVPNPAGYHDILYPLVNYQNNLFCTAEDNQYNPYLSKYDGDTVSIINKLDSSARLYPAAYTYLNIVFDNKLYFVLEGGDYPYHLGQYDGDSIRLIKFSNGYGFFPGEGFSVYNGHLYMECSPSYYSTTYYLAELRGDSAVIIDSSH